MERDGPWESFWRRTGEGAAFAAGAPQEAFLARFWAAFLSQCGGRGAPLRMLDVGCGNGAVIRSALQVAATQALRVEWVAGLDPAPAALVELGALRGSVLAVAADARHIPFANGSIDVVTSQFGIEYAGADAFGEVARVLAPAGVFAAVAHRRDGAMYAENRRNLEAMDALEASGALQAATELFQALGRLNRGSGSRPALREADVRLREALVRVRETLAAHGAGVAGGVLHRLHGDLAHMQARQALHDPDEVVRWARLMAGEASAYRGRMASMLRASLGPEDVDAAVLRLSESGARVRVVQPASLGREAGAPSAWVLIAERA